MPADEFKFDDDSADHSSFLKVDGRRVAERTYHYDEKGRLNSLTIQAPGKSSAYTIALRYSDGGRIAEIVYPDGHVVSQRWSKQGLL